jgi:biopolymer transport protein ExbD
VGGGATQTTLDDLGALLRSQIDEEQPVITIDCAEDVLMESLYQVHAILRAAGTYKVRYKGSGSPPVPLELPSKELMQKAQSIPAEHVAHLAVAAGGRCTLDAATIDTSDVRALVGERAAADDLLIVSLRMAPDATYGQYLRILGQLKAAHAHRVFVDEPGAS